MARATTNPNTSRPAFSDSNMGTINPNFNPGNISLSSGKVAIDPSKPIAADRLSSAPIATPPPVANTAAATALATSVDSIAQTVYGEQQQAAQAAAQLPTATAPKNNGLQDVLARYLSTSDKLGRKGERTLEIQEEEGVFAKKANTKNLENQILSKTRAYDRRIQSARENNPTGMLQAGQDIEVAKLERQKNSELADLAIQYKVANDDYVGAWEIAQAKVEAEFEPLVNELDTLKTYYQLAQDDMTESEKLAAQTEIENKRAEIDFGRQVALEGYRAQLEQSSPLYQANLANVYSQIEERERKAQQQVALGSLDASTLGSSPAQNNKTALTALLKSPTIDAGTRTQIANILGVINAADELAAKRADGKFTGFYPGAGILDAVIPNGLKRNSTVENEGYLEAINLKTQVWASGAALTEEQTKQVNRFLPNKGDTDSAIKTKLNNLTNFMLTQAASQLQSQGVDFKKQEVDLFGKQEVIQVGGASYRVGSQITNSNGQTGIVNQDGTITVPDSPTSFNSGGGVSRITIPQSSRLAFVNNNPGNLKFVGQAGAAPGEKGFARFPSPQAGFNALVRQIQLDASRGLTFSRFVNKFAPPTENNTSQYIQQVATRLGISPNTPIARINPVTLAKEVARKESSSIIS